MKTIKLTGKIMHCRYLLLTSSIYSRVISLEGGKEVPFAQN
jgi:hypothetical protein